MDGEGTVGAADETEASYEGGDFVNAVVVVASEFVEDRDVLL